MYRLIAIDLDGTLLNSYGEISEKNREALAFAKQQGAEIILASGRIASSIANIAEEVKTNHYFISGNGASVFDMQQNKVLYENYIKKEKLLELIKLCDENTIYYNIYTEESVIAKSIQYNVLFYHYENSKKSLQNKTNINIVEDVYRYIQESNLDKYLKVTICDSDQIIFSSVVRKLKQIGGLDILDVSHMSRKMIKSGTEDVSVGYYYTEVTNQNADKWYAIEKIMEIENVKPEEVMAIGDNMNDLLMLKKAGKGVAMGQSHPTIRENADFVTDDNNSDGVAKAIYRMTE